MIAKRFFTRRAFAVYFVMAYSGVWLSLLGLAGFTLTPEQALRLADSGVVYLALLAGPRQAGSVTGAVIDGRAFLGELRPYRLPHWHVRSVQTTIPETAFAA
jgi:hypothetical protein